MSEEKRQAYLDQKMRSIKQPKEPNDRRICKCECGGIVRGVESFGRLWTWCEKCTPVVKFTVNG